MAEREPMGKEIPLVHPLAILDYVRMACGQEAVERILDGIIGNPEFLIRDGIDGGIKPITREYFFTSDYWISNDLSLAVFAGAAREIGGERPIFRAGQHFLQAKTTGPRGFMLQAMAFVQPEILFSSLEKRYNQFNRTKHVKFLRVSKDTWAMQQRHFPHVRLHKNICEYNQGALDGVFHKVFADFSYEETLCQMEGDEMCEYVLKYQRRRASNKMVGFVARKRTYETMVKSLEEADKRNQEVILNLERMVDVRTQELNDKSLALEKLNLERMQFMADSSHELRTPLSIASGRLELLKMKGVQDPLTVEKTVDDVHREIEQMGKIITYLYQLARADNATFEPNIQDVSLKSLLRDVWQKAEILSRDQNITVTCTAVDDAIIRGDRDDLERLVMNLVRNGIRYNKPGGSLALVLEPEEEGVVLRVKDTGIGIPEASLPRIFDRFYTVNPEHSKNKGGSGLGLAIVKVITQAHKGRITCESEWGVGTTFSLWLPLPRDDQNYPQGRGKI